MSEIGIDNHSYFNGLLVSLGLISIGLVFTLGSSRSYELPTGKKFRSKGGEVLTEWKTHTPEDTDSVFTWSKIHKTILKFHFYLFALLLVIKVLF
jgi:hypothetical protein